MIHGLSSQAWFVPHQLSSTCPWGEGFFPQSRRVPREFWWCSFAPWAACEAFFPFPNFQCIWEKGFYKLPRLFIHSSVQSLALLWVDVVNLPFLSQHLWEGFWSWPRTLLLSWSILCPSAPSFGPTLVLALSFRTLQRNYRRRTPLPFEGVAAVTTFPSCWWLL